MANLVPPLLSDTPPPLADDQPDDDEFGDFAGPTGYQEEDSPPGTPLRLPCESPTDQSPVTQPQILFDFRLDAAKDFCLDKRKKQEDFGEFAAPIVSATSNLSFEADFKDFATPISYNEEPLDLIDRAAANTNEISCNLAVEASEIQGTVAISNSEEEFDDFGDFAAPILNTNEISCNMDPSEEEEASKCSNFDNSVSTKEFSCNMDPLQEEEASKCPKSEADFDDFGDFATPIADNPKLLLLNDKEALEKATTIVREMFPEIQPVVANFQQENPQVEGKIFSQIKNITETHALNFQWPKSASQKLLLKSLNIDLRNILYGPGWNPSMPRFASNLSLTPLEPVKTEISIPNSEPLPNSKKVPKTVVLRETHISVSWLEPTIVTPELSRKERPYADEEDEDDFGDFTQSLPQPLKPLPVAAPASSAVVWPDPGITDDEINRFEALGLARRQPPPPRDEEWTDFVSSAQQQNKSPLHRRCATPDLPLSVLNLATVPTTANQIQMNFAKSRAPVPQPRLNIISNQYVDQALGRFDQYAGCSKVDDEEWSDFVSGPMPGLEFRAPPPAVVRK